VYQWGRFHFADTRQTALALAAYSVGLAGYSAIRLLAPAFYALDDAITPMLVSVASIVVNLVVAVGLVRWTSLGHAGLALSTSAVALFGAITLLSVIHRRIHGIHASILAKSAARIVAAALLMGGLVRISSLGIHGILGTGKGAQFADLAISI